MHNIRGLIKNSFCDWEDKISCIVFIGGCNFNCPTCHNRSLVNNEEPEIDFNDVLSYIVRNVKWLDGVVISGGEPTLNPHIKDIVQQISSLKPIKLDSNGSFPHIVSDLMPYVDRFAIDIKGPFEKYPQLTGLENLDPEEVRDNFNRIFELAYCKPNKFEFRLTKVPFLTEDDIEVAKSYLPNNFKLTLQNYQEVR